MKHLLWACAILLGTNSASAHVNVKLEQIGATSPFDEKADLEKFEAYLTVFTMIKFGEYETMTVRYNCTDLPFTKTFCSINFQGDIGSLGIAAVEYDLETQNLDFLKFLKD